MRLLHVVPSYRPAARYGGAIVSVHGLCASLVRLGHQVDVFTTNLDGPGVTDVPTDRPVDLDGVRIRYFPVTSLKRIFWSPKMRRAMESRAHEWDLFHLHSVFLWPTTAAAGFARRRHIPYVLSPRGMLVPELIRRRRRWAKALWMALAGRQMIEGAACLHLTSEPEREALGRMGLRAARQEVVPNGIDLADVPSDLSGPSPSDPPRVVYLGRIHWKKGLDRLVEAMRFVPEAKLEIIGNDEENYRPVIERAAREAGVHDRVRIEGPIYGPEKYRRMARADVFVLPSSSENFGNAALEAMAAGCPVVVAPQVGLSDLAPEGGVWVCGSEPETLGPFLRELLADKPRLSRARERARATAERMGWGPIGERMQQLYQAAIASHHGKPSR